MFAMKDVKGTGRLTKAQVKAALTELGCFAESALMLLDVTDMRSVDLRSFETIVCASRKSVRKAFRSACGFSKTEVEELTRLFGCYDADDSGEVHSKELVRLV